MKILSWAQQGVKSYPQGQRWAIEMSQRDEEGAVVGGYTFYVRLDPKRSRKHEIETELHTWAAHHFYAWIDRIYRSEYTGDDSPSKRLDLEGRLI